MQQLGKSIPGGRYGLCKGPDAGIGFKGHETIVLQAAGDEVREESRT